MQSSKAPNLAEGVAGHLRGRDFRGVECALVRKKGEAEEARAARTRQHRGGGPPSLPTLPGAAKLAPPATLPSSPVLSSPLPCLLPSPPPLQNETQDAQSSNFSGGGGGGGPNSGRPSPHTAAPKGQAVRGGSRLGGAGAGAGVGTGAGMGMGTGWRAVQPGPTTAQSARRLTCKDVGPDGERGLGGRGAGARRGRGGGWTGGLGPSSRRRSVLRPPGLGPRPPAPPRPAHGPQAPPAPASIHQGETPVRLRGRGGPGTRGPGRPGAEAG